MLCLIAKLDKLATEKLAEIQKAALPPGWEGKMLYGHITLATYLGEDEPGFVRSCKSSLPKVSAFEVVYDKIEVLEETSILVATPARSEPLLSLHQRIAEKHGEALDRWTRGDAWVPHTTLVYAPQLDLHRICQTVARSFSPITARISRIEFSRVLENAYEIVDSLELSSR